MNDCQCKSGFFSLRDCGQPAVGQCSVCQRAMCQVHGAAESTFTQCRDCWARSEQEAGRGDINRNNAYNDDWAYSYRHRYYGAGYAPVYTGTHYHHYYDRYDARSFNERNGDVDDGSENARAGFGDS
jgi:hypothetical protein